MIFCKVNRVTNQLNLQQYIPARIKFYESTIKNSNQDK